MTDINAADGYIHGRTQGATDLMVSRSADREAGFFLPYLRSGITLLDAGCGPGTITRGIAAAIAPGQLTAIDISKEQVAIADAGARQAGVTNATFQTGSLLDLPFEDETFDAVFTHMVIEHIPDSDRAVYEIFRVLKPGGVYGARHSVYDGEQVRFPQMEYVQKIARRKQEQWAATSGDPRYGINQIGKMVEAGFAIEGISSSTQHFGPEVLDALGVEGIVDWYGPFVESEAEREGLRREVTGQIGNPLWFVANVAIEVVGRKPA